MEEVWVPVVTWKDGVKYDFTGLYEVSNLGNTKSLNYNHTGEAKALKPVIVKGYKRVTLSKNSLTLSCQVHRIVWESFNGEISSNIQVNHINEDKTDNRLSNLNLMTAKENINWGTAPKRRSIKMTNRTDASKPVIQYNKQGNIVNDWPSTKEIERVLNYSNTKISECCLGKRKSYKGYFWKYKKKEAV